MNIPSYPMFDLETNCDKCGCNVTTTQYHIQMTDEFLIRTCTRCNYRWKESPLDQWDDVDIRDRTS